MVKKEIRKKIILLGASSGVAKDFISKNKIYDLIKVGRSYNIKYEDFLNNKKIKNDYYAIIYFIGFFKKSYEKKDSKIFKLNYEVLRECLVKNYKNYLQKKRKIKFIIITSLDSIFPNINSIEYSVSKSAASHLILNLHKSHKNTKINYYDIQPGAIKTKMRKKKFGNTLKSGEITKTLNFILSLDINSSLLPIKIFPKLNNYNLI